MPHAPLLVVLLLVLVVGCSGSGPSTPVGPEIPGPAPSGPPNGVPANPQVRVEVVAEGLEHVWDIGFLPDGAALISARAGRFRLLDTTRPGAPAVEVAADLDDVYVQGEGGLMGLVVHPDFEQTRRFTTCQTFQDGGEPVDVRLVTWELSADGRQAERVADPLVAGLPLNPSGRHSGCRPTLGPDGYLYVGTGDAAMSTQPQDRTSLGGKTLRVDLGTGAGAPDNPFADSPDPAQRLVYTYGHRNVQGVAVRPGTDQVFVSEHGPDVDDEVNLLRAGGNYGWDPSQDASRDGYDESVPMTDLERFPDAVPAVWSTGSPPEAISGADFVAGPQWGGMDGLLAVAALRGSTLLLMQMAADGTVVEVGRLPELDGSFGRLRAVRTSPDGDLYVTTSNGQNDKVLRIEPVIQ